MLPYVNLGKIKSILKSSGFLFENGDFNIFDLSYKNLFNICIYTYKKSNNSK